ncbi:vacuolar protein sorting-associated protein, putative [Entamoeba dispar SAW760]|uniref:Vacuolar protein sorting-associated protein, putative n=1 Tax=Entamoeba dispar (strain ATCC PRA-260 / SAW760) TaxID=370354 RepID=B0EQG0_ENTDS|nr:vacuolar protein sorting-associated protein, putative [Entamoeba dispar SAW760]EDR23215.1 vacuolar protein sorting-associated protein, putative [Entamoeba dispar SAW760]|eukprot:EDR23215.1 vacuolar protein sorting-associated protein, putative [Entamoeba dispar SAW760]
MSFLFGSSASKQSTTQILFDDDHMKPKVKVERKNGVIELVQFTPQEPIKGKVFIQMGNIKKPIIHNGIKLVLQGIFECQSGMKPQTIIDTSVDLCGPNSLTNQQVMYPFEFAPLNQYESYNGKFLKLKYVLSVHIMSKSHINPQEKEFALIIPHTPSLIQPINQELGIEKIIQLDLKLSKNSYALNDVIMGSLFIRLLHVKICRVEMNLIRVESIGRPLMEKSRTNFKNIQLVDGQLVKGDIIPVRFFLKNLQLTPTQTNIADIFSVNYYLSFDFIDEEGMKYNCATEINLYRGEKDQQDVRMLPPVDVVDLEHLASVSHLYLGDSDRPIEEQENSQPNEVPKQEGDDKLPSFGDDFKEEVYEETKQDDTPKKSTGNNVEDFIF